MRGDLDLFWYVEAKTEPSAIGVAKAWLVEFYVPSVSFWATLLPTLTGAPVVHDPVLLSSVHESGFVSGPIDGTSQGAGSASAVPVG